MEPEREKPQMEPVPESYNGSIPMPGPGERVPMPAGPGSARRQSGASSASRSGLAAAALLTAGLAAALVFKGDFRRAQQPAPMMPPAVQVTVQAPLSKPPPMPVLPAAPLPSLPSPSLPGPQAETVTPAPGSFSSPLPFFSSDEEDSVPKVTALQPYDKPDTSQEPAYARPVLPAAPRLIPRLQPAGGQAAGPAGAPRGMTVDASGVCTTCKSAVSGMKTSTPLQRGQEYMQSQVTTVYTGICEGKYVYEYKNHTSNMTIGMKVVTSGGEAWTFTLKPGQKIDIKSSTELNPGTFENYRISEVIN